MELLDFIILLLIVIIVGSVFAYGFNTRGPWGSVWIFMLILLLAGFSGMLWITPWGPVYGGFAWIPVTVFIIFIALLVAAATPRANSNRNSSVMRSSSPQSEEPVQEEENAAMFGVFFWLLLILMIVAIATGIYI